VQGHGTFEVKYLKNASRTVLIRKLTAVFAMKSFLELGADECDNLNFMHSKTDSFKQIRKNSRILGNFKIRKIRILNVYGQRLAVVDRRTISLSPLTRVISTSSASLISTSTSFLILSLHA